MSLTSKYVKQNEKKSNTLIKKKTNLAGNLPTIRRKYTQTKMYENKKLKGLTVTIVVIFLPNFNWYEDTINVKLL